MAEDIPRSSTAERDRRNGSLARRALDRVRAAMKTRRSNASNVETAGASHQEARNAAAVRTVDTTGPESINIPGNITEQREAATSTTVVPSVPVAALDGIEDDLSEDETEEPLLPMRTGRAGLSTEKARELFAQHGFHYEPRSWRPHQEPPNKIRRVEKPIRLRVHYTCHECRRQFGAERTCLSCGHQRCRQCSRDPPRKVRDLSDSTRRSMEAEQARSTAGPSTAPHVAEPTAAPIAAPVATPVAAAVQSTPDMLTAPLDPDQTGEYTTDALPQEYDFTMYTRPRAAIQTVWKTKTRPRLHAHSQSASNASAEDQTPLVHAVRRVYRKPRQRVRYTCESCATLFTDGNRCNACGHQRCDNCQREPPKHVPLPPDPRLLEAVAARLAGHEQSPGITAGAV